MMTAMETAHADALRCDENRSGFSCVFVSISVMILQRGIFLQEESGEWTKGQGTLRTLRTIGTKRNFGHVVFVLMVLKVPMVPKVLCPFVHINIEYFYSYIYNIQKKLRRSVMFWNKSILFIAVFSLLTQFSFASQTEVKNPCVIVIFGATGDLNGRKLVPAIYNLMRDHQISDNVTIVGVARRAYTNENFRKLMADAIDQFSRTKPHDPEFWESFKNKIFYHQADFDNDQGYEDLKSLLTDIDQNLSTQGNRIFYLSTPPSYFPEIVEKLSEHGLIYSSNEQKWSRVVIEKPFGDCLSSALELQTHILKHLDESQVYPMDHYLGKEGVQNLLTLRFENGLFEPLWNKEYIDNVQILLSEDIGIGTRANYWEETGCLRDLLQNHLLQILSIVAMEVPNEYTDQGLHEEKLKALEAIRPFALSEMDRSIIRGQYGLGIVNGMPVVGYQEENGVPKGSTAETYVAAKFFIDNPRWYGVPFYIRAGKRLPKQTAEIAITFKGTTAATNVLFIRIQPNAGIYLKTVSKVPGLSHSVKPVTFGFTSDAYFETITPEAYEKLICDCIAGDKSLFAHTDEQLAAWRLLTPVLDYWKKSDPGQFPNYEAGTWGPTIVDETLLESGHQWQLLEK